MTGGIIKSLLPWPLRLLVGAKEAAVKAWGIIMEYPREAAIVALLCLSGWLWWGWNAQIDKTAIQHTGWVNEIKLRNADRKAYQDAQREAEAKQKAADQSNIAGQLAAIRQQDAAHDQLEAARRSAVSEFRTAGRVRLEAACRSASGAGVAGLRDNPRPPADGQADSNLVARAEDIEAFSQIELQNAERGQFLRGLVDQGLAIPQSVLPEPAFGGK